MRRSPFLAFSIGIGLGYRFPTSLQTPNVTSARFRLGSGLTFEDAGERELHAADMGDHVKAVLANRIGQETGDPVEQRVTAGQHHRPPDDGRRDLERCSDALDQHALQRFASELQRDRTFLAHAISSASSASFPTVFMLRAVPLAAAGITSFERPCPSG